MTTTTDCLIDESVVEDISSYVMSAMFNEDEFRLSTTKANKLVTLTLSALVKKGYPLVESVTIEAERLGPTNKIAYDFIKLKSVANPTVEDYETRFRQESDRKDVYLNPGVEAIVDMVLDEYMRFSPSQMVAITHADKEWFLKNSDKEVMDPDKMASVPV